MTKNYDLIKEQFIEFLANPAREESQGEFAKKVGVNQVTLSDWKRDPAFKERYLKRLEDFLLDDVKDVYKTMAFKAKSGDYNWGKLFLQQANILAAEKKDIELKATGEVQFVNKVPRPDND